MHLPFCLAVISKRTDEVRYPTLRKNLKFNSHITFASHFRHSLGVALVEHFSSFLLTLSCGYAASCMLDMAMIQDSTGLFRAGIALALLLVIGLPLVWMLSKWAEKNRIMDRQRFRELLYCQMLENRLKIDSIGAQSQLLGDISNQVAEQYQSRIPQIVEGLCITLGATVLLCRERMSIGILFMLMGLLQILPVFTYEKWAKKIYEESLNSDEAETDWIAQGVDGICTLKAYGQESWFVRRYQAINRRGIVAGNKAVTTGGLESVLYSSISALLRYGSYGILGLYVLYGGLSAASLPVFIVLSGYIFSSTNKLFIFFRYRSVYQLALQRLEETLQQERATGGTAVLQADGISKAFEGKQILSNLTITIHSGERVLLQGSNGSGKSTLIRILLGELTPDMGIVQLGGKLAVALQEVPFLSVSASAFIKDLEQKPDWHSEQFREHLHLFHFSEDLLKKPIQELSSGQQRKLFLAIALAWEADLLILDEPTNHLDADSLKYLQNILLQRQCAMLICTHDPALSLPWDQTLSLQGGVICG